LVIAGHNHYYARLVVDGVVMITTGGGGAPLYDVNFSLPYIQFAKSVYHFCAVDIRGDILLFRAFTTDLSLLDQTLVLSSNVWTYVQMNDQTTPGNQWRLLSYDDSAWNTTQFVPGDNIGCGCAASNDCVFYLRKVIDIADPIWSSHTMALNVSNADMVIVYVNAQEVINNVSPPQVLLSFSGASFVKGGNIIAVEVHKLPLSRSSSSNVRCITMQWGVQPNTSGDVGAVMRSDTLLIKTCVIIFAIVVLWCAPPPSTSPPSPFIRSFPVDKHFSLITFTPISQYIPNFFFGKYDIKWRTNPVLCYNGPFDHLYRWFRKLIPILHSIPVLSRLNDKHSSPVMFYLCHSAEFFIIVTEVPWTP
jgi:hypothetical protein